MKCPEETRQQLWELIYDLLTPEEAEALQARITSDPDVARAYSAAKLRADLVAAAARRDEARLNLQSPDDLLLTEPTTARSESSAVARKPASGSSLAKVVNWLACIAALALVSLAGFGYVKYGAPWASSAARAEREELAQNTVRLVLVGPGVVTPGVSQNYTVNTLDFDGEPEPATQVYYRVEDASGKEKLKDSQTTDDKGLLQINLRGDLVAENSILTIEVPDKAATEPLKARLSTVESLADSTAPADGTRWLVATGKRDSFSRLDLDNDSGKSSNLLITAENSGRQVARETVPAANESGASNGATFALPPDGKVSGATRVTLYDYTTNPPAPLVERYFFVAPAQKLKIVRSDKVEVCAPGDKVPLQFEVSSEGGDPLAADLRVAVVDEAELATHGRWDDAYAKDLSLAYEDDKDRPGRVPEDSLLVLSDTVGAAVPPLVLDNSSQVRAAYEKAVVELDRSRESRLRLVGQITLFGGIVLLGGLLIAAGLRTTGTSWASLPALVGAIACILAGFAGTTARVDSEGDVAFGLSGSSEKRPTATTETAVAQNDLKEFDSATSGKYGNSIVDAPKGNVPKFLPADLETVSSGVEAPTTVNDPHRALGVKNGEPESKKPALTFAPPAKPAGGPGSESTPSPEPTSPAGGEAKPSEPLSQPTTPQPATGQQIANPAPIVVAPREHAEARDWKKESKVDTVYTDGPVSAGADGRATVEVKVPNKPGVYRVFVEARSGDRLGLWNGKVIAREPVPAKEQPE